MATGEQGRLQRAHAEHYAAFAERAGPEPLGPAQLEWQHRIRTELDNLRAAVTWAMTSGDRTRLLAFGMVAALANFVISGPSTVGVWAEAGVAQIGACPSEIRVTVLAAAGWSAFFAGDLPLAQRQDEDALSLAGAIRARNGDLPGALAVLREATVQQHGDGNRLGLGVADGVGQFSAASGLTACSSSSRTRKVVPTS